MNDTDKLNALWGNDERDSMLTELHDKFANVQDELTQCSELLTKINREKPMDLDELIAMAEDYLKCGLAYKLIRTMVSAWLTPGIIEEAQRRSRERG
jgi:hypothetical protein